MKYQVGDIVLLLHSNEEAVVIDIINDKMMTVDVKGVKFPVYMDQVDFPYFKRFTEKKPPKKDLPAGRQGKKYIDDLRREKQAPAKIVDGVWISFLPVSNMDEYGDEVIEELKIHLSNRTDKAYKFHYKLNYFGNPEFELKNEVLPFQDFYLHDIPFEDLNDNPVFEVVFSLLQPEKNRAEQFETSLKLKPKQLFAKFEDIRKKGEATFSHKLFDEYPGKVKDEKENFYSLPHRVHKPFDAKKAKEHLEPARSVIDLHIEKITDDWKGLSNHEIVTVQLKTFEKYYDLAIAHMQPSLIVIHGLGTGKLKDDIHELLKHRKEVKTFVNQYHPLYGYGATEIYFEY